MRATQPAASVRVLRSVVSATCDDAMVDAEPRMCCEADRDSALHMRGCRRSTSTAIFKKETCWFSPHNQALLHALHLSNRILGHVLESKSRVLEYYSLEYDALLLPA